MKVIPKIEPKKVYTLRTFYDAGIIHIHTLVYLRFQHIFNSNIYYIPHRTSEYLKSFKFLNLNSAKNAPIPSNPEIKSFEKDIEIKICGEVFEAERIEADTKLISDIIGENGIILL